MVSHDRDFVKRPVLQTVDGDVIGCFRTREYEDCCAKVLKGLRVLNALQSCDTVALSMDFFRCHDTKRGAFAHGVLPLFEVISSGGFLMACPSVVTLKHRIWGETEVRDQHSDRKRGISDVCLSCCVV